MLVVIFSRYFKALYHLTKANSCKQKTKFI